MKQFIINILILIFLHRKWYHIFFPIFITYTIISYLFLPIYPFENFMLNSFQLIFFSIGRVFTIAVISSISALIIGFILSLSYFLSIKTIINFIFNTIFLFPAIVYPFIYFHFLPPNSNFSIIIFFTIIQSYSFFILSQNEIIKMEKQNFIPALYAIGLNNRMITTKHIFPNLIFPLLIEMLQSIIYIIQLEFILTVTGLVTLYPLPSIGRILHISIINKDILFTTFIVIFFTLFFIELRYFFQTVRYRFETIMDKNYLNLRW